MSGYRKTKEKDMKKETQKTTDKNKKILDIVRWVSILPIAYAEWWLCWVFVYAMDKWYRTYYSRAYDIPTFVDYMYIIIGNILLFIVPIVVVFFTSRFLAPKYKNTTAVIVSILGILFGICVVFVGLAHMAY